MSPSISARVLLTQSDARLVAFARAGHERAFEALVRRYRGPLLGYCRRLLLSEERAEDALQQALMQAWLALRGGTEVQNAKAWLYRIVHNSALNALRVSGYDYCTLSESLSGADAPQEDLDRRIAVREALAGLAALPEMQREALLRTAIEGSSHQETARQLGLSETAVRGLVYRARATLRAAAGAIVPPPLVSWALESGSGGSGPAGERLAELGAGGSAGVAGLLLKGGAAAVTAGMLASGIAAVHAHPQQRGKHAARASVRRHAHAEPAQVALVASRSAVSITPVADVRTAPEHAESPAAHRRTRRASRPTRHRHGDRVPVQVVPLSGQIEPSAHGSDDRPERGDRGGRGGDRRAGNPRAHDPGTDADGAGGGAGRHDGHRSATSGERREHGGSEHGSSGDGASGSASTGTGGDGGRDGNGRGEQADGTDQTRQSSDRQGSAGSSSMTPSGSGEDERGPADGKRDGGRDLRRTGAAGRSGRRR
jgi:RNA polymerase sigma factor (sigma-70 family)